MTTLTHRVVASAIAVFAAVLLTTALGCRTSSGSGEGWPSFRYQTCSADTPCSDGFECKSGHCVSEDGRFVMTATSCETREQCGYGMACVESACVVDVLDCVSDFDCVGDMVCVEGACVEEQRCLRSPNEPCYKYRFQHD